MNPHLLAAEALAEFARHMVERAKADRMVHGCFDAYASGDTAAFGDQLARELRWRIADMRANEHTGATA